MVPSCDERKANIYKCMHFYFVYHGDEELVRERMCCAIALSLCLTHSFNSHNIHHVPVWRRDTHTHSLNMRIQNYHLNKKDKNGLLCFIHLGKQQKNEKNKHCADWYITDTNQASHTQSFRHIHKNIHFYN